MNPPIVAQLIAQGKTFENRWRRSIPVGVEVVLGRSAPLLGVAWDGQISRQHVTVKLDAQQQDVAVLEVAAVEGASNPVFFHGKSAERFTVKPGEHFVIGETTFTFSSTRAMATIDVPNPISQRTFSHQFLKQVRYRDADRRIGVLNRLPDVIASAANEDDLMTKMVNTLMAGIATASAIGIVRIKDDVADGGSEQNEGVIEVKHWDRKSLSGGDFEASERLIRESIGQQQTVLHFWERGASADADSGYTFDLSNDWAFACPLEALQQDRNLPTTGSESSSAMVGTPAGSDWAIYVTGKNKAGAAGSPELANQFGGANAGDVDLEGDIKFCELIASTLKNLLQLRNLERRQSSLRRFFSPAVLKAFARRDPDEVLQPRQCEVSVLFCDLRGFSKTSEALADDLLGLLDHVSQSLGVMTRVILDHGGVIGDFHGDAAMGFWGWPLDQPDAAVRAARSAVEIQRQLKLFNQNVDHPFEMGIGIGTGPAVAGRIGTADQGKVTAFGPVVNLASRLESMSKSVGARILIDDATKVALELSQAEKSFGKPVALATVVPFGMQKSVKVYRLEAELDGAHVETINNAAAMFECGNWQEADRLIELVLANDPDDATCRLLKQYMEANVDNSLKVPHVIEMRQK